MKNSESSIKLGKVGKKFRMDVLKEFKFDSTHDFHRLDLAAHCRDRIEQARAVIDKEGPFVQDRFKVLKEHPALKVEREQKVVFCRIVRELNLDIQEPADSRPPGLY